jgi:hypothetical protein
MPDCSLTRWDLRTRFYHAGRVVLAALLATGYTVTAFAQTGPGNAASPNSTIPEKQVSPSQTSPVVGGSTSSGVIKPKRDVDPKMTKVPPAPGTESMPVIKPKGTPGGPPGAKPK